MKVLGEGSAYELSDRFGEVIFAWRASGFGRTLPIGINRLDLLYIRIYNKLSGHQF